jgi:hypothetical protein
MDLPVQRSSDITRIDILDQEVLHLGILCGRVGLVLGLFGVVPAASAVG